MQRLKFFKIQLVKGLLYWSENLPIMVEIRENTKYCALNAICRQICKWHQTSLTPVFQKHIGDA